jgi:serine/threonine-protein kinase
VDGKTTFKDMEIGVIKGDKVYILTYEGGIDEFDKYLPTVQQMINSFQITK